MRDAVGLMLSLPIAPSDTGGILAYTSPQSPISAAAANGESVQSLLATEDGVGYHAYDQDTIDIDFGAVAPGAGAVFVLRAQGFQSDTEEGQSTGTTQPLITIMTQDCAGTWVPRGSFYPRWKFSTAAYDLQNAFACGDAKIRLVTASCHTNKYHLIDYVGLETGNPLRLETPIAADNCGGEVVITSDAPEVFPLGTTTVTYFAQDANGNLSTASTSVTVGYTFIGFLPPFTDGQDLVGELGRGIPVKFRSLYCDGSTAESVVARLAVAPVPGTEEPAVSSGSANTGDLFRYDPIEQQYIFNLSTKPLSGGTWRLHATLDDGSSHYAQVVLR